MIRKPPSSAGLSKTRAFTPRTTLAMAGVLALGALAGGQTALPAPPLLRAQLRIENTSGQDKRDWPVFLTTWKLYGGNLPLGLEKAGFRVLRDGRGLPCYVHRQPSLGVWSADQLVVILPRLAVGERLELVIECGQQLSPATEIAEDALAANPNNLLRAMAFTAGAKDLPAGWKPVLAKGVKLNRVAGKADVAAEAAASSLAIDLSAGGQFRLDAADAVEFRKGGRYHFELMGECTNVAYNGWGFWNAGCQVKFDPPAFGGRTELTLRGDRPPYRYTFDPGPAGADGIPGFFAAALPPTINKNGKDVPPQLWQAGGKSKLVLIANQSPQPFLQGDKSGRIVLGSPLLFEQPTVTVISRLSPPDDPAEASFVFARPVNMPRYQAQWHERVGRASRLSSFAMPGERRQVRVGLRALATVKQVELKVSSLRREGGADEIAADAIEQEALGEYVEPYAPLAELQAGTQAEWLLGIDVSEKTPAGSYQGTVAIHAAGKRAHEFPLRLEVLPLALPDMAGYYVGGIYNCGMGLERNDAFYREYGKCRFNYLLLFDYLAGSMRGDRQDFAAADKQVDAMVRLGHVTGGIGLYREPNMSEDQPRKWYQVAAGKPDYAGPYKIGTDAKFKQGYQALARQADAHARQHHWPRLVYMVSDEPDQPKDVDLSMGWLKETLPDSVTICDAQFADMRRTWQWYSLPVFDDPVDWTGPLVYAFVRAGQRRQYGFCGTGWALEVARYQPGLMLASSGGCYWHFWHLKGPMDVRGGRVVRSHAMAAMAEGFTDLRYCVALRRRLEQLEAVPAGPADPLAKQARDYLAGIWRLAPADHDRHLMPYNGVPETWGDEGFYDRWRTKMKDLLLRLAATSQP